MARGKRGRPPTAKTAAAASQTISAEDLQRVLAEAARQKQLASEYAGNHGAHVKNACERYGLEKNALTFARRLLEMEEGKRQGVIRASIDYWKKLGFFNQIDAFDDLLGNLREIVEDATDESRPVPKRGDDVVDNILN